MRLLHRLAFFLPPLALLASCSAPMQPRADVEAIERQAPVTPRPNALPNAFHGANAVDYSNDRLPRNRGVGGYGGAAGYGGYGGRY